MSNDPFYRDILQALTRQLDPVVFESCAADLLRELYPGLVPIPGGNDAGMDGAIGDSRGEPYPLVCTTGVEVERNLRSSLQSYKDRGGTRRQAVFVTSRKLTPARRRRLSAIAREQGFALAQVYEQEAITNLLYHSPRWCRDLLSLTGDPPPLSLLPSSKRPLLDCPLVGRDADLRWLEAQSADAMLFGQPGSGKTYLLYQFAKQGSGLFLIASEPGQIAAGIRAQRPSCVIVDDAHTRPDLLVTLRRLRAEMGATFRIIADCWPNECDDVACALELPQSAVRELQLLTRDEIVEVIASSGITGPTRLVRELVDQAAGKPGLAVTLTRFCMRGGFREVAIGTALQQDVRRTFAPIAGNRLVDILAAFAIGGNAGVALAAVARELELSPSCVRDVVTCLASGGVIAQVNSNLAVWPSALRHALVRDTFFAGAACLPYAGVAASAADQREVTLTLIGAAACGGEVDSAMLRARLAGHCFDGQSWSRFAALGPSECRWVIDNFPDYFLNVAEAALHYVPSLALPLLLQRAAGDTRALHSHLEHPLRVVQDWVRAAVPGSPDVTSRRHAVMDAATKWLSERGDTITGVQAIALAMSPCYEAGETDAGSGLVFTITRGFIAISEIEGLAVLWSRAVDVIRRTAILDWRPLMEVVRVLVHPYIPTVRLSARHIRAMRRIARAMVMSIAAIASNRAGVLAWSLLMALRMRVALNIMVPHDYVALAGVHSGRHWRAAENKQKRAVDRLASEWVGDDPSTVANRLVYLDAEAAGAGIGGLRWAYYCCQQVAERTQTPLRWAKAMLDARVRGELLDPCLARLCLRT